MKSQIPLEIDNKKADNGQGDQISGTFIIKRGDKLLIIDLWV
jgi:hypothetical protein